MPISLRVVPADGPLRDEVGALAVHLEQLRFVGRVSDSLADVAVCPGSQAFALLDDDRVVGYVRIDRQARALADHPFAAGALGLRSFMVDAQYQGRGIGGRALEAIREDAARRHPDRERIVLTVNVLNTAATALYLRSGYTDSGQLYHGGSAGPQRLLWCPLRPQADRENPTCTITSVNSSS